MFVLTKTTIDVDRGVIDTEVVIASEDFIVARNQLVKEIDKARKEFEESGEDFTTSDYVAGDMQFSIWQSEWETSQRIDLIIHEVEVR